MSVRSCTKLALQAHQDRQDSSSSSSMIDRGYLGMAEALRADLQAAIHVAQHCGYCVIVEVWNVNFICFYLQTSSCSIWQDCSNQTCCKKYKKMQTSVTHNAPPVCVIV